MTELLQGLPKVDLLLKDSMFSHCTPSILKVCIQNTLSQKRQEILSGKQSTLHLKELKEEIYALYLSQTQSTIKPLINATGIVLQTNLGRSLLHPKILEEITPLLSNYNNLEYDIANGERSERYIHITHLLKTLLHCEDAIVVNNNASAVLLVLDTFGKNYEAIISRGELVEIGGAFRIPEVMKISGTDLIEVGTTNKTHIWDYANAITERTTILMKVHQSNFKQIGFCSSVDFADLSKLAQEHNLIDYYDLGSGYMQGLQIHEEPSILELSKLSPSLLSFSGDKLFGGPQAGIIIGKAHLIAKLKQNHLLRALRVDKFTILALEATLRAYIHQEYDKIPTITMLNATLEELHTKAQKLHNRLQSIPYLKLSIERVDSLAGGGSLPQTPFPSYGILCQSSLLKTLAFEQALRKKGVISRIIQDHICLDIRCIFEQDFDKIHLIFQNLMKDFSNAQ
ncbi:L-seryl-tRNA(Sec) selenium transferase [Helicobacter pametensis]|uniref:L-seryl-tRNA(Sec) selenium transferase n=1 Tax=Helicobacter pametensis TaxID=95149 RepID=UPI00047F432D|nr:L-seryl-tRNA(Sec) selenium transferase [Helicobacter pametensis]